MSSICRVSGPVSFFAEVATFQIVPSGARRHSTSTGQTGGAAAKPPHANRTTPAGSEITKRCYSPRFTELSLRRLFRSGTNRETAVY
jgi:hypothetical protein